MDIDDARINDVAAISRIFDWDITHTSAVWLESPTGVEERLAWMRQRQDVGFPVLVARMDGCVAGFASFAPYRPLEGYRFSAENSVFVDPSFQRRGVGRSLMQALIQRARSQSFHTMVAAIGADNRASLQLHGLLGFAEAGRLREMGMKSGLWRDLVLMQLLLDDRKTPGPLS